MPVTKQVTVGEGRGELPDRHEARTVPSVGQEGAAASTYSVPRRFLWTMDVVVQVVAFLAAWYLSPALHLLLAGPSGDRLPWLNHLLAMTPAAGGNTPPRLDQVLWIGLVSPFVSLPVIHVLGGYRSLPAQSPVRLVGSCLAAPVAVLSVVTLVLTTLGSSVASRTLIYALALFQAVGLFAYREAIRAYKRRRLHAGSYAQSVLVVGSGQAVGAVARHFDQRVSRDFHRLVGFLETGAGRPVVAAATSPGRAVNDLECLGNVDDLQSVLVRRPIHEVIAVHGETPAQWLLGVVDVCDYFHVTLRLVPESLLGWRSSELRFRDDGGIGLPAVVLRPRHLDSEAMFVKRVFDIVVSGTLLLILSPLFLLIAIAIKLTTPRLPVFYPWRVIGYKGRLFTGYKFTTMVADADERQRELMHLNEMSGPVFKIKDDPRVTPLGWWLRKYSLNELPQLWSVLKGDMSLVGPRPAYPDELARYELWQKRKLCVQPGITCLWQVRGRNRISSFEDWVRMDFEYIDNWSLWLDCRILLRTVGAVFSGSGW